MPETVEFSSATTKISMESSGFIELTMSMGAEEAGRSAGVSDGISVKSCAGLDGSSAVDGVGDARSNSATCVGKRVSVSGVGLEVEAGMGGIEAIGCSVGSLVGLLVGSLLDGYCVGFTVGYQEGSGVRTCEGASDGAAVGSPVCAVGSGVGSGVGCDVGKTVGIVRKVTLKVGASECT